VLSIYETIRLTKYALLCFYLEHNLRREQLKFVVAGICAAIMLQASLGVVQQRTGRLLGIGRTKGAADADYEQYTVTGFEAVRRAEGTTFDSHALALFFAMSLAIPLGLAMTRRLQPGYRAAAAFAFVIGLQGLIVSFARAGWVAFAGSVAVLVFFLVKWREWRTLGLIAGVTVGLGGPAALPFAGQIRQRLFEAPPELVTARFETIEMAWQMFKDSPLTGVGANAYMRALELKFSIFEGDPYFIPAHNMYVFVLTELGVIGALAFVCLAVVILRELWRATAAADPVLRILSVTLFGGFVAFLLQGLSDPIYATNVTYVLLWFLVGVGAAVSRMARRSDDALS
jgi:O-antigen ligase